MKQLRGHVYVVPVPQEKTGNLAAGNTDGKIRRFISGLLGLPQVPESWVKICAVDEDFLDEYENRRGNKSNDWALKGYSVDGSSPGILPFLEILPANLFAGKKENDTVIFLYGGIEVLLTLKQLPYEYGELGAFEEVLKMSTGDEDTREAWEGDQVEENTAESPNASADYPNQTQHRHGMPVAVKVTLGVIGGLILAVIGIAVGVSCNNR
jgi:hypothetical protein